LLKRKPFQTYSSIDKVLYIVSTIAVAPQVLGVRGAWWKVLECRYTLPNLQEPYFPKNGGVMEFWYKMYHFQTLLSK